LSSMILRHRRSMLPASSFKTDILRNPTLTSDVDPYLHRSLLTFCAWMKKKSSNGDGTCGSHIYVEDIEAHVEGCVAHDPKRRPTGTRISCDACRRAALEEFERMMMSGRIRFGASHLNESDWGLTFVEEDMEMGQRTEEAETTSASINAGTGTVPCRLRRRMRPERALDARNLVGLVEQMVRLHGRGGEEGTMCVLAPVLPVSPPLPRISWKRGVRIGSLPVMNRRTPLARPAVAAVLSSLFSDTLLVDEKISTDDINTTTPLPDRIRSSISLHARDEAVSKAFELVCGAACAIHRIALGSYTDVAEGDIVVQTGANSVWDALLGTFEKVSAASFTPPEISLTNDFVVEGGQEYNKTEALVRHRQNVVQLLLFKIKNTIKQDTRSPWLELSEGVEEIIPPKMMQDLLLSCRRLLLPGIFERSERNGNGHCETNVTQAQDREEGLRRELEELFGRIYQILDKKMKEMGYDVDGVVVNEFFEVEWTEMVKEKEKIMLDLHKFTQSCNGTTSFLSSKSPSPRLYARALRNITSTWRLLSQFNAQRSCHICRKADRCTSSSISSPEKCGSREGGERRLSSIVCALAYKYVEAASREWNAGLTEAELLEGLMGKEGGEKGTKGDGNNVPSEKKSGGKKKKRKKKKSGVRVGGGSGGAGGSENGTSNGKIRNGTTGTVPVLEDSLSTNSHAILTQSTSKMENENKITKEPHVNARQGEGLTLNVESKQSVPSPNEIFIESEENESLLNREKAIGSESNVDDDSLPMLHTGELCAVGKETVVLPTPPISSNFSATASTLAEVQINDNPFVRTIPHESLHRYLCSRLAAVLNEKDKHIQEDERPKIYIL